MSVNPSRAIVKNDDSARLKELQVTGNAYGILRAARGTLAYTDTTAKNLFTLPAGAIVVDEIYNVTTLFNSDGTDQADFGVSGTPEKFAANLDVSTTGIKTTGIVAAQIGAVQSTEQVVQGVYAAGGSAASAGAMTIIFLYYVPES